MSGEAAGGRRLSAARKKHAHPHDRVRARSARTQLNLLQRNQSLHENSIEHFPLFTSTILFSLVTNTPYINAFAATYLGLRVAYGWCYLAIADRRKSWVRTICWWAGNLACFAMLVRGGKRIA